MAPADPERVRASSAEWRRINQERIAAYKAEWRRKNKERIAAYKAAYNQRNRQQVTAQQRDYEQRRKARLRAEQDRKTKAAQRAVKYAAANPEKVAKQKRDWAANNPEKLKQARREYRERNRADVQQRSDAWRNANPDKISVYNSSRQRDPDALAEYTRQRRADPAKYARDLEVSRDRRRLIRSLQAQGLPPPQLHKTTAAERRTNGAAAREFFTRTRTALERRSRVPDEGPPPTAQELQDATRIRAELRNRAEIQQRTRHYLARHGERIRREIELDSRAREIRGATPLDIDAELLRRVRTFTDRYAQPLRSVPPLKSGDRPQLVARAPRSPPGGTTPIEAGNELAGLLEIRHRSGREGTSDARTADLQRRGDRVPGRVLVTHLACYGDAFRCHHGRPKKAGGGVSAG